MRSSIKGISESFISLAFEWGHYVQFDDTGVAPLFEHILAQWALESNWGKSKLAQHHKNFGGVKYRESLVGQGFYTFTEYEDWEGKKDRYFSLESEEEWVRLYFAFINRSIYNGWKNHQDSGSAYMKFIALKGYCGSMAGFSPDEVPNAYASKIEAIIAGDKFKELIELTRH